MRYSDDEPDNQNQNPLLIHLGKLGKHQMHIEKVVKYKRHKLIKLKLHQGLGHNFKPT